MDKVILGLIVSLIGWFMVASGLFFWNTPNMMPIGVLMIMIGIAINYFAWVIWNVKGFKYSERRANND